ncbi:hypothetical protein DRP77_03615 [Candidatus Poribacteria bacterium]|nr:MAG: hypothetical protein DRP77_03615 [Candidatus Poribacteria bacterium]
MFLKREDELSSLYLESIASKFENPLILRVTLGDMPPADGFYFGAELDGLPRGMSVMELIDEALRADLEKLLPINPDLPDISIALRGLFEEERRGLVEIRWFRNGGDAPLDPRSPFRDHLELRCSNGRRFHLLDLVLEVRESFDPFEGVPPEDREEFLLSLRAAYLLYRAWREGIELSGMPRGLKRAVDHLMETGLAEPVDGVLRPTPHGEEAVQLLFREAEFYIERYEIYGDVLIEGDRIEFNTGDGVNLIARAMERDGLSPQRAFFVLAIYFGHLDGIRLEELLSDDLFRSVFWEIFHSPSIEEIGEERFEKIMEMGRRWTYRGST